MADQEWDSVTKIGSKVRSGGAGPRETVVKGKAALNAAQRSGGIVATEKKYGPANAADKGTEGQRLTKVDRSDDVVAPIKNNKDVGKGIAAARSRAEPKMTQAQLAQKVNSSPTDIKNLEAGTGVKNQQLLNKVCRVLKISPKTGEPLAK